MTSTPGPRPTRRVLLAGLALAAPASLLPALAAAARLALTETRFAITPAGVAALRAAEAARATV